MKKQLLDEKERKFDKTLELKNYGYRKKKKEGKSWARVMGSIW